jgi:hypothetical protein
MPGSACGDLAAADRQFGRLDARWLQGSGASSIFRVGGEGVEDSAAAERRAEVSERQLAFVRSLIFFYRARCHVCQIPSALGHNFARWNFFTARCLFKRYFPTRAR